MPLAATFQTARHGRSRMSETSLSLLDSLRASHDPRAWQRLVDVYRPLIGGYLRRQQLAEQDVEDVTQEVLAVVVRRIGQFERQDQVGSFRSWLRQIAVNCMRDFVRRRKGPQGAGSSGFLEMLEQLEDPDSGLSQEWDRQHDRYLMRYLCQQVQGQFSEKVWSAFYRVAMQNEDAEQVAADLAMSVNAVRVAKSRVLKKLREHGAGLLSS